MFAVLKIYCKRDFCSVVIFLQPFFVSMLLLLYPLNAKYQYRANIRTSNTGAWFVVVVGAVCSQFAVRFCGTLVVV